MSDINDNKLDIERRNWL